METGKLIRELRIKKGMTQEELADKTEVSASARTIQRCIRKHYVHRSLG